LAAGYYLAGFFSYEAGNSFEERLIENRRYDFPLLRMGVYDRPQRLSKFPTSNLPAAGIKDLRFNISQAQYFKDIQKIRDYIAAGEVYQITYCLKALFRVSGDPLALYSALFKYQPVPYPAYIADDDSQIISLSPEKFIEKKQGFIITSPMKGTWPRGNNLAADFLARWRFQFDPKNRAENVMIADLLRNDLGRFGRTVKAPRLFEVAKYRTLYQMTSTVTAKVDAAIPLYSLFASLFPSGSVTGAPKIRAMQIIRELEPEARRIYTGAIGYITPGRDMFFNIPIRTILLRGQAGEMGIGGGIVWDSTPQGEWEEGMLKAAFLKKLFRDKECGGK